MFFIFTSLPKALGISYMGNPKVCSYSFSSSSLDPLSSSSLSFLLASLLIISPSNISLSTASLTSLSNISLYFQSTENSLVHSRYFFPSLIGWLDCVCLDIFPKDEYFVLFHTSRVSGLVAGGFVLMLFLTVMYLPLLSLSLCIKDHDKGL